MEDIAAADTEFLTWRLGQAAQAVERSERGQTEDKRRFDKAPNGLRVDRDERDALAALLREIGFVSDDDRR